MKYLVQALVVVVGFFAIVVIAEAQVYVPGGGYPVCFPQTVWGPTGPVTIVVCQ